VCNHLFAETISFSYILTYLHHTFRRYTPPFYLLRLPVRRRRRGVARRRSSAARYPYVTYLVGVAVLQLRTLAPLLSSPAEIGLRLHAAPRAASSAFALQTSKAPLHARGDNISSASLKPPRISVPAAYLSALLRYLAHLFTRACRYHTLFRLPAAPPACSLRRHSAGGASNAWHALPAYKTRRCLPGGPRASYRAFCMVAPCIACLYRLSASALCGITSPAILTRRLSPHRAPRWRGGMDCMPAGSGWIVSFSRLEQVRL